jgi:ParB family chromosome partitioning protein
VAASEQNKFTDYFGTKVEIQVAGNGKGKITIPFHSEEDFKRIVKLIKG